MSGFFETLSNLAGYISDGINMLTSFFNIAVNGLVYLTGTISYIPQYVSDYMLLFIGISIVLLIINRG